MTARNDMVELAEKGKSAKYIKAVVQDDHNLTNKEVEALWKEVAAELDIAVGGAQGNLEALVRTMREFHGKMDRKELVSLMAEKSGYTESTANHMLSQLNFAKEYAKQVNTK